MESKNRKKIFILLIMVIALASIMGIYFELISKKLTLYEYVDGDDYEIKYIVYSGTNDEHEEITIDSEGKYTYNFFVSDALYKTEEGYYNKNEIKEFAKYAINKNIAKMTSDMNAKNVYDGSTILFEFKFGERVLKVGGYGETAVSKGFRDIKAKFLELESTPETSY